MFVACARRAHAQMHNSQLDDSAQPAKLVTLVRPPVVVVVADLIQILPVNQ